MPVVTLRACGATVARLTPDQKVACSNHVGVIRFFKFRIKIVRGINIIKDRFGFRELENIVLVIERFLCC